MISSSQAATLINYNFTGGVRTAAGTYPEAGSDFSGGSIYAQNIRYRADVTTSTAATSTSLDATFTFTVQADTEATLTNLQFDYKNNNTSSTSVWGVAIYASTDGGANYTLVEDKTTGGLSDVWTTLDYDLTTFTGGSAYSAGDTITFGLSVYDPSTSALRENLFDSFKLVGDVTAVSTTIPEPTAITLLGLGGLALITRRKR